MADAKLAGFLLLLAGWGIVMSAIALLRAPAALGAFMAAGLCVEGLGLALAFRAHRALRRRA